MCIECHSNPRADCSLLHFVSVVNSRGSERLGHLSSVTHEMSSGGRSLTTFSLTLRGCPVHTLAFCEGRALGCRPDEFLGEKQDCVLT
jgi:hypothetical protein